MCSCIAFCDWKWLSFLCFNLTSWSRLVFLRQLLRQFWSNIAFVLWKFNICFFLNFFVWFDLLWLLFKILLFTGLLCQHQSLRGLSRVCIWICLALQHQLSFWWNSNFLLSVTSFNIIIASLLLLRYLKVIPYDFFISFIQWTCSVRVDVMLDLAHIVWQLSLFHLLL